MSQDAPRANECASSSVQGMKLRLKDNDITTKGGGGGGCEVLTWTRKVQTLWKPCASCAGKLNRCPTQGSGLVSSPATKSIMETLTLHENTLATNLGGATVDPQRHHERKGVTCCNACVSSGVEKVQAMEPQILELR